jgi:hypothetical protein
MFHRINVRARLAVLAGACAALAISTPAVAVPDGDQVIGTDGTSMLVGSSYGYLHWFVCTYYYPHCVCRPDDCPPIQRQPHYDSFDSGLGYLYGFSADGHVLWLDVMPGGSQTEIDLGEVGMDLSGVTGAGLRPSSPGVPARAVFAFSDGTFWRMDLVQPFQLVQLPTPVYARDDINAGHTAQIEGLAFSPVRVQASPVDVPWVAVDKANGALVSIDFANGLLYTFAEPRPVPWDTAGSCHWISLGVGGTGRALLSVALQGEPGCDAGAGIYSFDLNQQVIQMVAQAPPPNGAQLRSLVLIPARPGAPCNPDFNGDGDVGTDADIQAFFECLAGNCCPTCGSADFNGDGDAGTDLDIQSFFSVLAGGPC